MKTIKYCILLFFLSIVCIPTLAQSTNIFSVNDTTICLSPNTWPVYYEIGENKDYNTYIISKFYNKLSSKKINAGGDHIVATFIVEKDGAISNISIVKGNNKKLKRKLYKIIKGMKYWQPATYEKRPVRCLLSVSIYVSFQ